MLYQDLAIQLLISSAATRKIRCAQEAGELGQVRWQHRSEGPAWLPEWAQGCVHVREKARGCCGRDYFLEKHDDLAAFSQKGQATWKENAEFWGRAISLTTSRAFLLLRPIQTASIIITRLGIQLAKADFETNLALRLILPNGKELAEETRRP